MPHPHAITWFELPTRDLKRAVNFYQTVLGTKLTRYTDDPDETMYIFPSDPTGLKGALVHRSFQKPGSGGATVYLNVDGDLDGAISRIPQAGGLVLMPRTPVPGGSGAFACFRDSEGNAVGLHSSK